MQESITNQTYSFKGFVELAKGQGISSLIYVPDKKLKQINYKSRIRIQGKINEEIDFNLAIQSKKTGEKYLSFGSDLRRKAKVKIGDNVFISFQIVSSDFLEFPEELQVALEQDEIAAKFFKSLTIGFQRSLIHYINSAKSIEVRINRALKILDKVKNGEFEFQKKKKG